MKRFVSIALALILALSFVPSVRLDADAAFNMSYVTGHAVQNGVSYDKYSVTSEVTGKTLGCSTLTFNPSDGFIPMVFAKYSGTATTLNEHYSDAVNKYGYNVAGAINGSFFGMTPKTNYGSLIGIDIVNGKIACAYAGYSDYVVAFGSDGSMNIVHTNISYTVGINGQSYTDMFYAANRRSDKADASQWNEGIYYFDTSCGSSCDTYDICPGTEILCRKLDNTDLAVGQTLVGEVISVKTNTYGGSLGAVGEYSDRFILFMKNGSGFQSRISGVAPGDRITISTQETVAASREIMEKANSVIADIGSLVKDGVDQTQGNVTIGHSVTYKACWTAFGQKPDGSYVFFTSEGNSTDGYITLRDVAKAMMQMGCNNVVRLDGGGSTAMYLSNTGSGSAGYVQSTTRQVADCILVASRAGATNADVKAALLAKINAAEAAYDSTPTPALRAAIDQARAVYDSTTSVMGDHKREIMELQKIDSASGILESALNAAMQISSANYSDLALDRIEYAYLEGKSLLSSGTDAEKNAATQKLQTLIEDTSNTCNRVSLGAVYATQATSASYPDQGLCELTDGALFGDGGFAAQWAGYNASDAHGSVAGRGSYMDIKVDLGEAKEVNGFGVSTLHLKSWGIGAPFSVEVYASDNGDEYYYHSALTRTIDPVDDRKQVIPYECVLGTATTNRYYIFRLFYSSSFIFVGEVSIYGAESETYASFTAFNKSISQDDTVIFDSGYNGGVLDGSNGNLTWSAGAICRHDADNGRYVVQQALVYPNGGTSYSYTVPEGGIIIGMHDASDVFGGYVDEGYAVYLTGIDVSLHTKYPGARVTFLTPKSDTVPYAAPTLPVVKTAAGAGNKGDGYIRLPRGNMTADEVKALFLDPRATATGGSTGSTATVSATGTTYTLYVSGDLSCDSLVNNTDYVQMKKTLKGMISSPEGAVMKAADLNSDNMISAADCCALGVAIKG